MKVYRDLSEITSIQHPVLTIGTFDGVHAGHQKIIKQLNEEAKKINGESVLITFFPHPRMVLNPSSHGLKLIQTQTEKIENLAKLGLDHLLILPFTKEFGEMTSREFVTDFLVNKLKVHTIVVGYDHQFGKNREGNLEQLLLLSKEFNFQVIEIPAHDIEEVKVSSTKIRQAIQTGDVHTANIYLNEPFSLSGIVEHGDALGRKIGFPTANIAIQDDYKILPAIGVYAVKASLMDGRIFNGMLNVGKRPTVTSAEIIKIEVHLFDFDEAIYDQKITVFLLERIRGEHRFESIEILQNQLKNDEQKVRAILSCPA